MLCKMLIISLKPSYNLYCGLFRTQSINTPSVLTRKEPRLLYSVMIVIIGVVGHKVSCVPTVQLCSKTHTFLPFFPPRSGRQYSTSIDSLTSQTERPHQGHSVGTLGKCESASKTLYFCNSNECKGLKTKKEISAKMKWQLLILLVLV